MKLFNLPLLTLVSLLIIGATGCNKKEGCTDTAAANYQPDAKKDDGSCSYVIDAPEEYNFDNVSYSGQTSRIELLSKLSSELSKAGDGQVVKEQDLIDIFENNGVISADKNLAGKVFSEDKQKFYDYFTEVENLTSSSGGGDTIIDGRFYNPDGVEIKQMVEKGLMGAVLYYQATSVYLETDKMNVDNTEVEPGKGTTMEHHFDEAFGYLGVPKDFKTNNADKVKGDYTGSAWFWGHYILSHDDAVPLRNDLFDAFVGGRTSIVNNRSAGDSEFASDHLFMRDKMIEVIKEKWELLVAANVVHYINSTISDIENNKTGDKWHHWSEAKAFHACFKYNVDKSISDADWTYIDGLLKESPKNITKSDLEDANMKLQSIFNFSNSEMLNL